MTPSPPDPIVPIPPALKLSYEQSYALMSDAAFRGRIQVSCLTYATYISGEPAGTAAHNSRYKWAQQTFAMPAQSANTVQPVAVMSDQVQAEGSEISDMDLQTAVENSVDKML